MRNFDWKEDMYRRCILRTPSSALHWASRVPCLSLKKLGLKMEMMMMTRMKMTTTTMMMTMVTRWWSQTWSAVDPRQGSAEIQMEIWELNVNYHHQYNCHHHRYNSHNKFNRPDQCNHHRNIFIIINWPHGVANKYTVVIAIYIIMRVIIIINIAMGLGLH